MLAVLGVLLGFVLSRFLIEPVRGAADAADVAPAATAHAPVARGGLSLPAFLRMVARTPTLLCLMGAFMCANFVAVVLLSWMPKFLYDKFHMGLAMAGLTATIFVQLASMAGAPVGGSLADMWRERTPRGRLLVQMIGVLGGAPFVALCGLTPSVGMLILALTVLRPLQGPLRLEHLGLALRRGPGLAPWGRRGDDEHGRAGGRRRQRAASSSASSPSARAWAWRSRSPPRSTSPRGCCSSSGSSSSSSATRRAMQAELAQSNN